LRSTFPSLLLGIVLTTLAPTAALADWRKAESANFIVYSDGSERGLRDYTIELERIDQLMRAYFGLPQTRATRPLSVYLVSDRQALRTVEPALPPSSAGVYSANFRDMRAIAVRASGEEIVRHEYGHHFMFSNFPGAYPAWFREGFAEFFMTATGSGAGQATVGRSSLMRIQTLNSLRWLPMDQVLTGRFSQRERTARAAFYAQAWLLTHWILTDPDRRRRMDAYLSETGRGVSTEAALQAHFGLTTEQLGETLRAYFHAGPRYAEMDLTAVPPPTVTITDMPASADDLLLLDLNARNGATPEAGAGLLARIRSAAQLRPGDRFAQTALARAEVFWGDPQAAEAILAPLLAAAADDVDLLLLMADVRLTQGERFQDPAARERTLAEARVFLERARQADPDDHRVYQSLAHSRRFLPGYPGEQDVELWRRAVAIAPQVASNRPIAAEALLKHGHVDEARRVIQPIANDPHGGEISPRVQRILDAIAEAGDQAPDA
jgi:Protein of unknown function (DUF1570)